MKKAMKLIVYRIFGIGSIVIGGIMDIWTFMNFFVDYFSGPNAICRFFGLFICYSILMVAGILFLLNKSQSILLYKLFLAGIILDSCRLYLIFEFSLMSVYPLILPAIPILLFLMYSHWGTYSMNYKKE